MKKPVFIIFLVCFLFACLVIRSQPNVKVKSQDDKKIVEIQFNTEDFYLKETFYTYKGNSTSQIAPSVFMEYIYNQKTGEPALPYYYADILVPSDAVFISFNPDHSEKDYAENIVIEPVQIPVPTMEMNSLPERTEPDPEIYNSGMPYPADPVEYVGTRNLSRYRIFSFRVSPFIYYPAENKLALADNITFTIEYKHGDQKEYRWDDGTFRGIVKNIVENPEDIDNNSLREPKDDDIKYLIITEQTFTDDFQPLADWKTQKGMPAEIVAVEDIYTNYSGSTDQLKIKTCIQDYYINKGTVWVVLGGDETVVPDLNSYGNVSDYYTDNTMPADLFYGCFDDEFDWNGDGDGKNGEVEDDIDMDPEVFIARAPIRTANHIDAYVSKVLAYEQSPATSDFVNKMLLSGLQLWNTWSGHSDADWRSEVMWSDHIDPLWGGTRYKFYDTDTDFGGDSYDITYTNMSTQLNDGYGYMHMATHGLQEDWSMESGSYYSTTQAGSQTNTNKQGVIVTIACITNAFDGDYYGSDPCLSEAFIRNDQGGCAAYFGSSRYGWGNSDQTTDFGASFTYNSRFFNMLFQAQPVDNSYMFGAVAAACKAEYISSSASNGAMRWLQFNLNPIGDPAMDLHTDDPSTFTVNVSQSVIPIGNSVEITIGTGIAGALVCLSKEDDVYIYGYADNSGNFACTPTPETLGEITVTATAHNRIPNISTISVEECQNAYVILEEFTISDPDGNNNSLADYDEDITLNVTLYNVGLLDASNVSATVTTSDPYISITDDNQVWGDIASGTSQAQSQAYSLTIADNVPDQHLVSFDMTITDGTDTWNSQFTITCLAPVLAVEDSNVVAGVYLSGTDYTICVNTMNIGNSGSPDASCVMTTTSSDATVTEASYNVGILDIAEEQFAFFCINTNDGLTPGQSIPLTFTLTAGSYSEEVTYNLNIFSQTESWESGGFGSHAWQFDGTNIGESSYWQVTTDNPYAGTYCAKSGPMSSSQGGESTFQRTYLIIDVDVPESGETVSFYKKVSCEPGEGTPYDWYDFLSFDIDGELQGQWDGEVDWSYEEYSVPTGQHTLRWIYEKDGYVDNGDDCAWLDDITLPVTPVDNPGCYVQTVDNEVQDPRVLVYPNPSSGQVNISLENAEDSNLDIIVYDIFGRVVEHINLYKYQNNEKIMVDLSGKVVGIYYISILKKDVQGDKILKTAKVSLIK